jgi:hypothetical protein
MRIKLLFHCKRRRKIGECWFADKNNHDPDLHVSRGTKNIENLGVPGD